METDCLNSDSQRPVLHNSLWSFCMVFSSVQFNVALHSSDLR